MKPSAYPELVSSNEKWFVEEDPSRPRVEFGGLTMSVPLSQTTTDRFVRLHEMAHVKWTPRNKSASKAAAKIGCPEVFVQCAEDARMAFLLRKYSNYYVGENWVGKRAIYDALNAGGLTKARVKGFAELVLAEARAGDASAIRRVACAMLAASETGDRQRLFDALDQLAWDIKDTEPPHVVENLRHVMTEGKEASDTAWGETFGRFSKRAKSRQPSFATTCRCAELLAKACGAIAPSSWAKKGLKLDDDGNLVSSNEIHDEKMESAEKPQRYDESDAKWGQMKVESVTLERPNKGSVAQKRVASLLGVVPRRIDRWATDKRIFDTVRRTMGGCVLLDASGSMCIEHHEISALAAASPNMKVAMYSGQGTRGKLTVIADKGKAASEAMLTYQRDKAGYSNIVDGPALRWLGKQKGPLIWVSDAEVFGSNDESSTELRQEVARICKSAGIVRMPTVQGALDLFQLLKKSKGKLTPSIIKFANQAVNQ